MKKGVVGILLLVLCFSFVSAGTHMASEVLINIDGIDYNLQEMVDDDIRGSFYSDSILDTGSYELAGGICVSTFSGPISFLEALQIPGSIVPMIPADYSGCGLIRNHTAAEIIFDAGT